MTETAPPQSAPKSALILLAAGNSTRMGAAKQLLNFAGKPMLRHAAETSLASGCRPVIVVLGAREAEIRPVLQGLDVRIVVNDRWAEGMGTSIQAGLRALNNWMLENRELKNPEPEKRTLKYRAPENRNPENPPIAGAVLALSDQPFITSMFLSSLVEQHRLTGRLIVAAQYAGTAGVPAFFARQTFPLLMALSPDQGCKPIILNHPADTLLVDCPEAAKDIDTPEDYARAQ